MFFRYQREAVVATAITNSIKKKYFFFGASVFCAHYIEILKSNGFEVIVVDNDMSKKGTVFNGAPIIHFDDFRELNSETETLLIATYHFMPVYKQLIENNLICSLCDVMPYRGKNDLEKEYIKGFEKLYGFWYPREKG
jgi:hypothetical protein